MIAENDPFNQYFYPSITGEVNYPMLLNKFLEDSREIRKLNNHYSKVTYTSEYQYAKFDFQDSLKQKDYIS